MKMHNNNQKIIFNFQKEVFGKDVKTKRLNVAGEKFLQKEKELENTNQMKKNLKSTLVMIKLKMMFQKQF